LWSKEIGTQYLVFFFLVSNSPGYVRYARRKVKQKVVEIKKGEKSSNSRHILEKITLKMREKKWAKLLKIAHRRRKHEERLAWNTLKNICCLTLTNVKSRASSLDTDGSTADVIKQHDGLKDKRNK
jgi:hypothetical protein